MDEYPNSDEEFELAHAEELELLREIDDEHYENEVVKKQKTPEKSKPAEQTTTVPINQITINGKKRLIEDLFGDIDDLLNENNDKAKKLKKEANIDDLLLIEQILELRKAKSESYNWNVNNKVQNKQNSRKDFDNEMNLSLSEPNYLSVQITCHDNRKIYVRCHSESFYREQIKNICQKTSFTEGTNSNQLWDEVSLLLNKKHEIAESQQSDLFIDEESEENNENNEVNTKLWVDSYKPKKYLELLSDEGTNRSMLKWIKLWDKVVFNRQPKIKINPKMDINAEFDEYGRPKYKVALLCGPPGLGKTTLAHMVARHAGYNVIEINASDDRSPDTFKHILENATQMRSILDKNNRPNCIVFDEIDGAPQPSIDYLIKYIMGVKDKKRQNKKKTTIPILKRPIICICNDGYTTALRPLRQIAYIINFPQTSSNRLAERLMEISLKECIKTDFGVMLAMAKKSNNDIRTCLSILNFFKTTPKKQLTLNYIHNNKTIGEKDIQNGLFTIWQNIFYIDKQPQQKLINCNNNEIKLRIEKILKCVRNFGDYNRLCDGIYENYLNVKTKNLTINGQCEAINWFQFNDLINKQIYKEQNYDLMDYLPYCFVIWHLLFCTNSWQKLQYPTKFYENKLKLNKTKTIIKELFNGMQPLLRSMLTPLTLIMDIIPLIKIIILPKLRSINLNLLTNDEKIILNELVSIMIDYNLNYIQERTPEGSYVYKLEPEIDELGFNDNDLSNRILSYGNKQLIAKEIELQKMRRFNQSSSTVVAEPQPQKLDIKTIKQKKIIQRKDFFGRVIEEEPVNDNKTTTLNVYNDIWYQYKEGYSNAVRKKIKIIDLK